jgi:hypothetical protein
MKRRGKLSLINRTVYDWIKTYQKNDHMARWQFPEIIPAKSSVEVFIEWEKVENIQLLGDNFINYVLFGSRDRSFQIKTSTFDFCRLEIHFLNLKTSKHPVGSVLSLGWKKSDIAEFTLAGMADEFEVKSPIN